MPRRAVRSAETVECRQKEIAVSEGRLGKPLVWEWLINGVADKIKDEGDDFAASEERATLFDPAFSGELLNGFRDEAEAGESGLEGERLRLGEVQPYCFGSWATGGHL